MQRLGSQILLCTPHNHNIAGLIPAGDLCCTSYPPRSPHICLLAIKLTNKGKNTQKIIFKGVMRNRNASEQVCVTTSTLKSANFENAVKMTYIDQVFILHSSYLRGKLL